MITEDMKRELLAELPKHGGKITKPKIRTRLGWSKEQLDEVVSSLVRDSQVICHRGRGGSISRNTEKQDTFFSLLLKYLSISFFFFLPSFAINNDDFWRILTLAAPVINLLIGFIIATSAEKLLMILYQKSCLRYGFLRALQKNRAQPQKINGNHLQSVFISLVNGRRKYASSRFGIYRAMLPKWQLMSRVSCYVSLVPPLLIFLSVGFLINGHPLDLSKESILLINYYLLFSSLLVALIIHQWYHTKVRRASLLIYHPTKRQNAWPLAYFFDFREENMLTRDELMKYSEHQPDPEQRMYVMISSRLEESHGLYNQDTHFSFSKRSLFVDL